MAAQEVHAGQVKKRILVVDDSTTVRMLLCMNLRRMIDASVIEAIHGVDALEKLKKDHYDLVVTDMNMPLMGGAELVKRIRTELSLNVPLVILTTMGEDDDRDQGLSLGANEYCTKPVDWNDLRRKVVKLLFGQAELTDKSTADSDRVDAMFLYLIQHGEAKKEEEDPQRGLTDKGSRDVALSALYAREYGVRVDRIIHSGKTRAVQTAQILAERLKPGKGVSPASDLAPMDDPAIWHRRLSETREDMMLVGHLPYLAKLASLLLCGDKEKTFVDFKMGGIVCLKRSDDGKWLLEWMVVPEKVG